MELPGGSYYMFGSSTSKRNLGKTCYFERITHRQETRYNGSNIIQVCREDSVCCQLFNVHHILPLYIYVENY